MATRKRVWLSDPWHNYADRLKYLVDENNYTEYVMYSEDNTHFNHGDGINSSCVTITEIDLIEKKPNYLLIFNGEKIESRHYVMQMTYISGEPAGGTSKWQATLFRDIVIDRRALIAAANNVKTIRGSIEPGKWSPLLCNPENITTNDILLKEIELKDRFGVDWYTIYYDANNPISLSTSTTEPPNMRFTWAQLSAAFTFADGESLQINDNNQISTISGRNTRARTLNSFEVTYRVRFRNSWGDFQNYNNSVRFRLTVAVNALGQITGYTSQMVSTPPNWSTSAGISYPTATWAQRAFDDMLAGRIVSQTSPTGGARIDSVPINRGTLDSGVNAVRIDRKSTIDPVIDLYNNNYINVNNNAVFFTVNRPTGSATTSNSDSSSGLIPAAFATTLGIFYSSGMGVVLDQASMSNYQLTTEIFNGSGSPVTNAVTLNLPQGNVLDEVVVGCITIPVSDDITIEIGASGAKVLSANAIKRLVTGGVTASAGRDNVYAIEKLPYCPIPSLAQYYDSGAKKLTIPTGSPVDGLIQAMQDVGNTPVWWGFRVQVASSSFVLEMPVDELLQPTQDLKRRAMTDSIKLSSPNHTAQMVINPVANQGLLRIQVQTTLRPNGTFYRWQPEFRGLHGFSTKDDRGIVQEGGFSIPIVTNAYIEFTRTNSMYREIFNTEVQFMEANNNIGRTGEQMNAEASYNKQMRAANMQETLALRSSALAGISSAIALGGSMAMQNPMGMAGSGMALAGAGVSAGNARMRADFARNEAGIDLETARANIALNDGLRANSIAQKSALLDLDIATIKNRANTINQTSILNSNNRGNAYIQIFTATANEVANIEAYLKINAMSINQFGNIKDYLQGDRSYIEAVIQFLEGGTPLELNAINSELSRGVYIQEGLFEV